MVEWAEYAEAVQCRIWSARPDVEDVADCSLIGEDEDICSKQFGKVDVVWYSYGLLLYENMTGHQHPMNTHREAFMQVVEETFCE